MQLKFNLDWLKARSVPLVGLDIGTSAIKMVELSGDGQTRFQLERFVVEPLPAGAVSDGSFAEPDKVVQAIRQAWKALGTRTRTVALALPATAVISKKLLVPATLKGVELEQHVEREAAQLIPFALDEVNLDFQVLGVSPTNPADVEVLLAAARKEKVEDRVAAVEAAGLKAAVMDVETYAALAAFERVVHLLPESGQKQTVALVDVGVNAMHVQILHDAEPVYQRELSFGCSQLNNDIARRYGMTPEEAERACRTGRLPENHEIEVLQPFSETLAMEVARAFQLFTSSTQYRKVDQVVVAGGGGALPGIDEVIAQRTGIPTLIADPFCQMSLASGVERKALAQVTPTLFVACGLALRRFDTP